MLTRNEMIELADWLCSQRERLEDEDGADPVQDEHAYEAWKIVCSRI